jgi:Flp pilus assembly protein TadD
MGLRGLLSRWISGGGEQHNDARSGAGSRPESNPGSTEAETRYRETAELVAAGRLPEAERSVARALECRHDYVEALLLQSAIFREQGRLEEAADSLTLAVHYRPDQADAYYLLGDTATSQGRADEAERAFRRALTIEPSHARAHNALGALLSDRGALNEAVNCFRRAIAIRPEFAPAHSNLGSLLITQLDQFDEGAKHVEEAIRLAPDAPAVRCNRAMLLQYRGEFREALAQWNELIGSGALADDSKARVDRAMILLLLGDFQAGWDEYERRFDADRKAARDFGLPRWNGEALPDKTILVYAEQGVGDEIMFASCLPDLIGVAERVIVECSDRLEALFRRSFPGATVHGGRKNDPVDWLETCGPIYYQIPIGSLPRQFRRNRDVFPGAYPYLRADAGRVEYWRARLRGNGTAPAIGISWRGGTAASRSQVRSVPPELIGRMLPRNVTWVSLQHGPGEGPPPLSGLRTFSGITEDLDELAALMGALDLVVSVANTNVHLAGALGRPLRVLVSDRPEWRYGASGNSLPWYPSAKLYRRDQNEGWDAVLARLARELDDLFGQSGQRSAPA